MLSKPVGLLGFQASAAWPAALPGNSRQNSAAWLPWVPGIPPVRSAVLRAPPARRAHPACRVPRGRLAPRDPRGRRDYRGPRGPRDHPGLLVRPAPRASRARRGSASTSRARSPPWRPFPPVPPRAMPTWCRPMTRSGSGIRAAAAG